MFNGPGVYDALCTQVQRKANASVAIVMICGGNKGNGFSVALTDPDYIMNLPELLQDLTDSIRRQRDELAKVRKYAN
jgi:hypothetical protein